MSTSFLLVTLLTCSVVLFACRSDVLAEDAPDVIVTGKRLVVNGQNEIPVGVFGIHNFPLTEEDVRKYGITLSRSIWWTWDQEPIVPGSGKVYEGVHPKEAPPAGIQMVLDCVKDRYQPAAILESKDWRKVLETSARNYAEKAKESGFAHTLEFWNEPYLNWASRPAVNYDWRFFKEEGREEGAPMTMKTTGETYDYMVWTREMKAVNRETGFVHYLATRYAHDYRRWGHYNVGGEKRPFKWEEGFEFEFRGVPLRMQTVWWGRDTTQERYYSSKFNEWLYSDMLKVYGAALKEANPDVTLVAGWDRTLWVDNWLPFTSLYKPMIDKTIDYIDGLSMHNYGNDTRMVTGSYEVLLNYAEGVHGKRLGIYNTEAGGMADPEAPGNYRPSVGGEPDERARGAFSYFIREVMHLLHFSPDKIVTRAYHQPQNDPGGMEGFLFLKPLRGTLMEAQTEAGRVWTVASLQENTLVSYVWNDAYQPRRNTRVRILPPAGMTITAAHTVTPKVQEGRMLLPEAPVEVASPDALDLVVTIPPRSAVKVVVTLAPTGSMTPPPHKSRVRTQYTLASPEVDPETGLPRSNVLQTIAGGKPETALVVDLPEAELARADGAVFRMAFWHFKAENASVKVNGTTIPVNLRGEEWLVEVPIDRTLLKPGRNEVSFGSTEGHTWSMQAGSIVLLRTEE